MAKIIIQSMYKLFLILLGVFLLAAAPPKRPAIIAVDTQETIELAAGANLQYPLELQILKGFHVQANPASEKFLIPLTVKLESSETVQTGTPVYPAGRPFRLKGSDRDISTYENKVVVKLPLKAGTTKGDFVLKGTIRYQGCDQELCFPPVTIPVELKLRIM